MSHTDNAEKAVLDWLTQATAPTRPVFPLMVRLMTTMGTEAANGTEVTGGSYAPQSATFPAASGNPASTSNDTLIRYDNMPAVTVNGFEIWDSATTPIRWRTQAFGTAVTFNAGDPAEFAVGALTLTED